MGRIKILFQGDSVTDNCRDRENPDDLGTGYPKMIEDALRKKYPGLDFEAINRGVSGDRVVNLIGRWEDDVIAHAPDFLTVLIGINDTWRRYDSNDPTSAEDFETGYRSLVGRARDAVPDIKIILMEPFLLPSLPEMECFREDLDPKIHAVRRIAVDCGLPLVPLDGLFARAAAESGCAALAEDGIHPTPEGFKVIVGAWLDTFGKIVGLK